MPAIPDRWAILRIRFAGPFVVVRLKDSDGDEVRTQWEGPFAWPAYAVGPIANRVQSLANQLPIGRFGPYTTGPVPLALFVDVPRFLWANPPRVDNFLLPLNAAIDANRVQIVGLSGSLRRRRPLFTLPFRILAHGPEAHAALLAVTSARWIRQPAVQRHGFAIDTATYSDAEELEGALRAVARDVLVTDQAHVAIEVSRLLPLEQRPRLILSVDPTAVFSPPTMPPTGVAIAMFGSYRRSLRSGGPVVQSVLYGFVHDLPIHEAVKATVRTNPAVTPLTRIFADPFTNQSLRIRDALITLQAEAEELDLSLPRTGLMQFLTRAQMKATGDSAARIEALRQRIQVRTDEVLSEVDPVLEQLTTIQKDAAQLRSLPNDFENFERESEGLVPMADTASTLSSLSQRAAEHAAALSEAMRDPELTATLDEHQERVVDIALQRLDTSPLLSPLDGATTLEAGALYRVRVHVGNPQPDTLVVGPQPPVDPLLPVTDGAGHMLDVVVQGKDFEVIGERTQPLHLPRFGGSRPVSFSVRTPRSVGPATLRVHVYYQNHLVQSYLLQAEVSLNEEHRATKDVLRVSLAYARIDRLAAIDQAKPRLLSIGMNQGGGGTHDFVVKGTAGAGELKLPALTYKNDVDKFRDELLAASRDPKDKTKGRIYKVPPPGAPASPQAAKVLRELIRHGASVYQSMKRKAINSNRKVAEAIDALQKSRSKKIQIVRFDSNDVFPWVLLYDFYLPPALPDAPVCLGTRLNDGGVVEECGHKFDSGLYCVNGFWSVRHYLEELLKRENEMKGPVVRPVRHGVRLVCNTVLAGVSDLHTKLETWIGAPHVIQGPITETALLDLLWATPPARPAVLVVLGHMDEQEKPGILDSPGIILQSGQWLTQQHVDEKLNATGWDQPRSVVLLMACESAAMTATTINNLVSSFHTAGAAAVIGVESVVASDLASTFARDVTHALWSRKSLGETMTTFRRETLAKGNPLAFLFHAIGDIDLTIQ